MTGILAIENCDLTDEVEIPKEATGIEGSSVYLSAGDRLTVGDLVYSLLLQSANDAACALAYIISGDIGGFASLMNKKASELGLKHTHFDNPHGLDSETHYTSAADLALLASYALNNPTFKKIVSTYKYKFCIGDKERLLVNHNKLLRTYDGAIGVKTGYTDKSGRCLVSAIDKNGIVLIAVTLDDGNDWADHRALYDSALESLTPIKLSSITETSFTIPILGAKSECVRVKIDCPTDATVVKYSESEDITVMLEVPTPAIAPIKAGDVLGEAVINVNGVEALRYSVVAEDTIQAEKTKRLFIF